MNLLFRWKISRNRGSTHWFDLIFNDNQFLINYIIFCPHYTRLEIRCVSYLQPHAFPEKSREKDRQAWGWANIPKSDFRFQGEYQKNLEWTILNTGIAERKREIIHINWFQFIRGGVVKYRQFFHSTVHDESGCFCVIQICRNFFIFHCNICFFP